jgi:ATP-dependent Lon protease
MAQRLPRRDVFALIPIDHKRTSLEVSADIIEHVDPIFFADPWAAAVKALALT